MFFLVNGDWQAILTIEYKNQTEINIAFKVTQKGQGEAFFQFPLVGYSSRKELLVDDKKVITFDDKKAQGKITKNISIIGTTAEQNYKVTLTTTSEGSFAWPIIHVNVREPGVPPLTLKEAVTILSFSLNGTSEVSIAVSINTTII